MKEKEKKSLSPSEKYRYHKCYLAVPLPKEFQPEFEKLLSQINSINPDIRTVNPKKPHITLLRMGFLTDHEKSIAEFIISSRIAKLWNEDLTAEGMGIFRDDVTENPDALYLEVLHPKVLVDAHNFLRKDLAAYIKHTKYFPFHPHMTLGYIPNQPEIQTSFDRDKIELNQLLGSVKWNFQIKEIGFFGKDLSKEVYASEKLRVFRSLAVLQNRTTEDRINRERPASFL